MKNILILIVFVTYFLTSCNKRYMCTCTIIGTTEVNTYDLYNSKRKATKNCNNLNSSTKSCVLEAW